MAEGEWNNFEFLLAKESDAEEISQHVRTYFLKSEQMNKYLGWCEENAANHDQMIRLALSHGISWIIRDKTSGELAGVNLVWDSRLPGFSSLFSEERPGSAHFTKLMTFVSRIESGTKSAVERLFPCEFHAELFITSVGNKYRGQGIALEAYSRMLLHLKSLGFTMVQSGFTSPATRAIARKLGFQELGRLYFKDQLDSKGRQLFPTAGDGPEEFPNQAARFI